MRSTALVATVALIASFAAGCMDGTSSARIDACVESTKFGAFVGDQAAVALWDAVGQDDDALRTACTDIGEQDPDRLARISQEWEVTQRAMREASPPTTDSRCDPSYPAMCIRMDAADLDCSNVGATEFPVVPPDRHGLDSDHDGFGCVPGSDTG